MDSQTSRNWNGAHSPLLCSSVPSLVSLLLQLRAPSPPSLPFLSGGLAAWRGRGGEAWPAFFLAMYITLVALKACCCGSLPPEMRPRWSRRRIFLAVVAIAGIPSNDYNGSISSSDPLLNNRLPMDLVASSPLYFLFACARSVSPFVSKKVPCIARPNLLSKIFSFRRSCSDLFDVITLDFMRAGWKRRHEIFPNLLVSTSLCSGEIFPSYFLHQSGTRLRRHTRSIDVACPSQPPNRRPARRLWDEPLWLDVGGIAWNSVRWLLPVSGVVLLALPWDFLRLPMLKIIQICWLRRLSLPLGFAEVVCAGGFPVCWWRLMACSRRRRGVSWSATG